MSSDPDDSGVALFLAGFPGAEGLPDSLLFVPFLLPLFFRSVEDLEEDDPDEEVEADLDTLLGEGSIFFKGLGLEADLRRRGGEVLSPLSSGVFCLRFSVWEGESFLRPLSLPGLILLGLLILRAFSFSRIDSRKRISSSLSRNFTPRSLSKLRSLSGPR